MNTPRPFFETLRELRRGAALAELAERLQELTYAVVQTGKPGKLTIELKLAPAGSRGTALLMTDNITLKAPHPDQASTIFFPGDDGSLSRSDPNQMNLRLHPVPTEPARVFADADNNGRDSRVLIPPKDEEAQPHTA